MQPEDLINANNGNNGNNSNSEASSQDEMLGCFTPVIRKQVRKQSNKNNEIIVLNTNISNNNTNNNNNNGYEQTEINNQLIRAVLSAKTYSELPNRLIIASEFMMEIFQSYGIIPYCYTTQRWLLVRRRHSTEFIYFMRGSYRQASLYELFNKMSIEEVQTIKGILELSNTITEMEQLFVSVFNQVIFGKKTNHEYAFNRLIETLDIIKVLVDKSQPFPENAWFWPKGMRQNTNETPFNCACREFKEETGLTITSNQKQVSSQTITETLIAKHGQTYETKLWIFLFAQEIAPPPITDLDIPGEIGARRWVSTNDAIIMMRSGRKTFDEAIKMIDSYFNSSTTSNNSYFKRR
jgi:8-oxo-dGTP pyrophosphatase MutT (NUDIX family)